MPCQIELRCLGLEAHEVEPHPCGRPGTWVAVGGDKPIVTCDQHLGYLPQGVYTIGPF